MSAYIKTNARTKKIKDHQDYNINACLEVSLFAKDQGRKMLSKKELMEKIFKRDGLEISSRTMRSALWSLTHRGILTRISKNGVAHYRFNPRAKIRHYRALRAPKAKLITKAWIAVK